MKKLGMLLRVSCFLDNYQAYILFTCFLKNKKKNEIKYYIILFIRQLLKQLIFTVLHKFQKQFTFMSTVIYKLRSESSQS